ncbi:metallophosphoesterase [Candidatus Woesearchaeota archaeon]|nr:metallophosphoesterase [Candidatus Woesearchaeota archaeon]
MNLLCFVDLHESNKAFEKLAKKAEKSDALICAGDFTNFERRLKLMARKLESLKKKIFLIPGNHETVNSVKSICEDSGHMFSIHRKVLLAPPLLIVGHGGGGFAEVDEEFELFIEREKASILKLRKQMPFLKLVLVTHAPPFRTILDTVRGNPIGCRSYRRFIDMFKPDFAIAGHIHENAGKEGVLGKTKLLNPGAEGKMIII